MVDRIGTVYTCGSNKGFTLRFCVDSQVRNETPEGGRNTREYKDEGNSPNILINNDYLPSSPNLDK